MGIVALPVAALWLVACDRDEPEVHSRVSNVAERLPEPTGYEAIEFEDGGSIAGNVRWVGPRPELGSFAVNVHRAACGETQPPVALRVSPRGGVAGAVVSLVDIRRGRGQVAPTDPFVIARRGCQFHPFVATVGVGWTVRFENQDPVLHNTHGTRDGTSVLDLGLPELGAQQDWRTDAPGAVRLVCDAGHGWELGWLHVFDHPYHAVTDENGHFRISDVPPGRYSIRVWHAGWRVVGIRSGRPRYSNPVILTRGTSVSSRQETGIDFELSQQAGELAGEYE